MEIKAWLSGNQATELHAPSLESRRRRTHTTDKEDGPDDGHTTDDGRSKYISTQVHKQTSTQVHTYTSNEYFHSHVVTINQIHNQYHNHAQTYDE